MRLFTESNKKSFKEKLQISFNDILRIGKCKESNKLKFKPASINKLLKDIVFINELDNQELTFSGILNLTKDNSFIDKSRNLLAIYDINNKEPNPPIYVLIEDDNNIAKNYILLGNYSDIEEALRKRVISIIKDDKKIEYITEDAGKTWNLTLEKDKINKLDSTLTIEELNNLDNEYKIEIYKL